MSFQDYAERARRQFHMGNISMPVKIGAAAIALLCALALFFALSATQSSGLEVTKNENSELQEQNTIQHSEESIYVHVAGCVNSPGMYKLPATARVGDAIEAAGGFTESAAPESVNLARQIQDGEQIIVADTSQFLRQSEQLPQSSTGSSQEYQGKVNLNTADETQLQTISGIGPSKAKKIIAYREANGPFKSVDDLKNVSGIGEKTLESIRDQICV